MATTVNAGQKWALAVTHALAMFSFLTTTASAAAASGDPIAERARISLVSMPRSGERLILTGAGEALRLSILDPAEPDRPLPLPLVAELTNRARLVTFGSEERCQVAVERSRPSIHCAVGRAPAGVVVALDGSVATGARIVAKLRVSGSPGFAAQLVAAESNADAPTVLDTGSANLEARPGTGLGGDAQLTIVAPRQGGTLRLESLMLVPSRGGVLSKGSASAWVWEPRAWQNDPAALVTNAARRGIGRLSITIPIKAGHVAQASALAEFVALARKSGIAIHAVEGDPHMVQTAGLESALERAHALGIYQQQAPKGERLSGIEYDIEPYSLRGWGRPPADFKGWARAVSALAEATGAPINLVVPFWLAENPRGRAFLEQVKISVSGLTVMSYRTNAAALSRAAQPLLDWGVASGKPIRLGLEAGPLADEWQEIFVQAKTGTIALSSGRDPVAKIFTATTRVDGSTMYRSLGRTKVAASRLSFQGDEAQMMRVALVLEPWLTAWPSFAGYAFHGLRLRP